MRRLVIGTRRSKLAMTQTGFIIERLRAAYPDIDCRMRFIGSPGDRDRRTPLSSFGGIGAFIRTIQQALLEKAIDVAVHSFKDLPTAPVPGLVFGAIPKREVPFDAICGAMLEELPAGAAIGTGSVRRRAQLLRARPDISVVSIRGNVVPRLKKLEDSSSLKAVVLAAAGLNRLGLSRHVAQLLEGPGFLPAAGQGALAVECRADDVEVLDLLSTIHDKPSGEAVRAERSVLHELHGGCNAPIGILARIEAGSIELACEVLSEDGARLISASGHKPVEQVPGLVQAILRDLRAQGAADLLERPRTDAPGRGAQPETKPQDAEFGARSGVNAASDKLKTKRNEDAGEAEECLYPFLLV